MGENLKITLSRTQRRCVNFKRLSFLYARNTRNVQERSIISVGVYYEPWYIIRMYFGRQIIRKKNSSS